MYFLQSRSTGIKISSDMLDQVGETALCAAEVGYAEP
jgi:hypothetical protein